MMKFKVGDRVRFKKNIPKEWWFAPGWTGVISRVFSPSEVKVDVLVGSSKYWAAYVSFDQIELVSKQTSIAKDLKLKPQSKSILCHLETRSHISPMEALVTYGISRLAACIHDIKRAGYAITRTMKKDAQGHRYAQYALVK